MKKKAIVLNGVVFKAQPYGPGAACLGSQARYAETVNGACEGVPALIDVAKTILRRLNIERAEKGEGVNFPCAALVPDLQAALKMLGESK